MLRLQPKFLLFNHVIGQDWLVILLQMIGVGIIRSYAETGLQKMPTLNLHSSKQLIMHALQVGLPEGPIIYACSNQLYKYDPETFATWMRILHRVPDRCAGPGFFPAALGLARTCKLVAAQHALLLCDEVSTPGAPWFPEDLVGRRGLGWRTRQATPPAVASSTTAYTV